MATRKRRVRPGRTKEQPKSKLTNAKRRLTQLAKGIEERLEDIDVRRAELAEMEIEARQLMEEMDMHEHTCPHGRHERARKRTKARSDVNVEKYLAALRKELGQRAGTKAFIAESTIAVATVRARYPEKIAAEIIDTKPAPPGEIEYKFVRKGQVAKGK